MKTGTKNRLAVAAAAVMCGLAALSMPTRDELIQAQKIVEDLTADDVRALMNGENPEKTALIAEEFADVMMYGMQLARTLGIDVAHEVERKIDIVDHRPVRPDEPKR